jgi:cysteine desulfurase
MSAGLTADKPVVYLDNAATTPLDPRVRARMLEWLGSDSGFANPASSHLPGRQAAAAVEQAREEVAALLNARPPEIVWTSGATEANNLAILGAARAYGGARGKRVVTVRTEHSSVLEACRQLAREGFDVVELAVEPDGALDPDALAEALAKPTCLVSIMAVNNETGVVHPLPELVALVKSQGALLHVDAVQAAGRLPLDVSTGAGIDLMSVSAHKLYGPKGVGALYLRRQPRIRLQPLLHGGGQEGGLRPGTLPVHQLVGMGEACRLARALREAEAQRLAAYKQRLWQGLQSLGGVLLNGRLDGAPHILNVSLVGVHGEALTAELPALAASGSSACTSASGGVSHVLRAMGVPEQLAHASLRLSIGRFSTEQEIDRAVEWISAAVTRLRAFSPVWRVYCAGSPIEVLYRGEAVDGT